MIRAIAEVSMHPLTLLPFKIGAAVAVTRNPALLDRMRGVAVSSDTTIPIGWIYTIDCDGVIITRHPPANECAVASN